jgi:iron complex transport system ATP-binding protein
MLRLSQLSTGFLLKGKFTVLHSGLDVEVDAGDLVLIVGRNGIGKSTLLKSISGLLPPIHGSVEIDGKNMANLDAVAKAACISIMLAMPPSVPMTTAREMVFSSRQRFFSPWQWNLTSEWEKVKQCMIQCGVFHLWDSEFDRLSDGEKQKVMLARCLAQEAPVLLLDEPLAFLDYPSRREMLALLRSFCLEQGKTIIYSSHDLDLALLFADKLLLLESSGKHRWMTDTNEIHQIQASSLFSENE